MFRNKQSTSMTEEKKSTAGRAEEPDSDFLMSEDRAQEILERRAKNVSVEDIEDLNETLKEKTQDLKDLEEGLHWVGTLIGRAKLLYGMIRDKEFVIEMSTKVMVAAALLYFVVPADLLPDVIPGIGYVDDAFVLGTLWKLVTEELSRYIDFLDERGRGDESLDSIAFDAAGTPEPDAS